MPMDAARWATVQTLFEAALDHDTAERDAFLREACGSDAELYREVASLLNVEVHSLLEGLALDAVDLPSVLSMDGERVGPYRIVREIGRGGMGAVYLAERADGAFEQTAALKLVKRGMDSESIVRRFEQERQILARLQHPGIARLLDGGLAPDGRPFFAMEVVVGEPITDYCDARALGIGARLALFECVCEAVAYAHRNLVVHRDLKPSNILVTTEGSDRDPSVKLLDFGIARLLDSDSPGLTWSGLRPMTPEYAAPEQVRGGAITTATDVYALGVLLYELLTGRRPHALPRRDLRSIERAICETDPERPSLVVNHTVTVETPAGMQTITAGGVSHARATTPDRLCRQLAGDLDTIVLKALRKEPEHRYGSAEALAADLRRYRDGAPVLARRATAGYRVRKFVMRHRAGVAATAGAVAVLAAVVGFYTARLTAERDRAQLEAAKSTEVAGFLTGLFRQSDPLETLGDSLSVREVLEAGAAQVEGKLAGQPLLQAEMLQLLGEIYSNLGQFARAEPLLERAVTLRRAHAAGAADLAAALRDLGTTRRRLDRLDEAEPVLREALALQRRAFGSEHPEVAVTLREIGTLHARRGDYADAEAYYRSTLAMQRTLTGDTSGAVSHTLSELGTLFERVGRLDEAEAALQEALALDRARLGERDPAVAVDLANLGLVLRERGRTEAAERAYRDALAIERSVYGDDHPAVATTMRNLASLLRDAGQYDEAATLYERALAVRRARFGPHHPRVANLLNSYGQLHVERGDFDRALATYREVVAIYRRNPHPEPALFAPALHNLADVYEARGERSEAEAAYRESLSVLRAGLPPESADLAFPLTSLGSFLADDARPAEAVPLLREAVALRRAALPPEHALTALSERRLSDALAALGRRDEAESLLYESITRLTEAGEAGDLVAQARARLDGLREHP